MLPGNMHRLHKLFCSCKSSWGDLPLALSLESDWHSAHLKGFQTLYSFFSPSATSTLTLFSLYTL